LVVLLLFVPQLFMRAPDEEMVTEDSMATIDSELGTVETAIGVIEWGEGPPRLAEATLHRVDGIYYARYLGSTPTWEQSTDGLSWTPTFAPLGSMQSDYTGPDWEQAVFDVDGQTWATVGFGGPTSGPMTLLERDGGNWIEASFEYLQAPAGVAFVDVVENMRGLEPVPTYFTTVVMHDGQLMMIRKPSSSGHEMVLLGSEVFAMSDNDASLAGFDLWRSSNGDDWSLVDLPYELAGDLEWAHLSAGHGRLLLAVRHVTDAAGAHVWTSEDGQTWLDADMPNDKVLGIVLPRPTDNGWAMYNPGEPNGDGQYQRRNADLLISADGVEWERVPYIPRSFRSAMSGMGPPLPIVYEAGLMVRDLTGFRDHSLVGRVDE
jgi:hypothetical protein